MQFSLAGLLLASIHTQCYMSDNLFYCICLFVSLLNLVPRWSEYDIVHFILLDLRNVSPWCLSDLSWLKSLSLSSFCLVSKTKRQTF